MRKKMEVDVSEVLSSVVEDVAEAVSRNISGAELLQELLNASWLRALLKIYECLLQFQRQSPSPVLPYASGLSCEIMTTIQRDNHPSAEARELFNLLSSPHIQALLSSHDSVAQSDYLPVLPPLPDDLPDDEEAMRIVCLVKNNQPLRGAEHRGSLADGVGVVRGHWSSLHRLKLERLVPTRRVQSESEATPLSPSRGRRPRPFIPRYQSTGSCCLCPGSSGIWKQRLNHSAPDVYRHHDICTERLSREEEGASSDGDDYAYPPPPVPAYDPSLPKSPLSGLKSAPTGQSRRLPPPNEAPVRVCTAPGSPAARQQPGRTLGQHGCKSGPHDNPQKDPRELHYATVPRQNGCRDEPKLTRNVRQQQPDEPKPELDGMEELRSTVRSAASSIEHSSRDVVQLGQKMAAATEAIAGSVEENAQALSLLAQVVDKLQGIIAAQKPPTPHPPRLSSLSPKAVRKPPTPYPRPPSPDLSVSGSSSSSSISSCSDVLAGFKTQNLNEGSRADQRAGGSNGDARVTGGKSTRARPENTDCVSTGCLKARKKKK
ncbi:uncharacterized protein ACNS7B_023753 isoform 2-T2 [Menidia menidia]